MARLGKTMALVAALAVLTVPGLASGEPTADRATLADRVQVRGSEFDLVLSKQKLRPGKVIIQFLNNGEDPHDLRIVRIGDEAQFGFGMVGPTEYENLETGLRKKSSYVLWCSLPGHRESGMEAVLKTKQRRR